MLRKDIEIMLKSKGEKQIDLIAKRGERAMYCFLQGGYLVDCWGKRVDRTVDFWGYIEWDGKGNADRVSFDGTDRYPTMRGGFRVCQTNTTKL